MNKIISLFQRNYETDYLVRDEVVLGAEWVLEGQGIPTRKWNGTCCMIKHGKFYKRYTVKKDKKPPVNFEASTDVDPNTGKQQGWVKVSGSSEDKWYREAFDSMLPDGTYELVGPKIQKDNPEGFEKHILIPHGKDILENVPRDFEGIKKYLIESVIEGIVWHHPDGRMVKIKKRDFVR